MKTGRFTLSLLLIVTMLTITKADLLGNQVGTYELFSPAARTTVVGEYGSYIKDRTGFNSAVASLQSAKSSAGSACTLKVVAQHSDNPVDGVISNRIVSDTASIPILKDVKALAIGVDFTQTSNRQLRSFTVKMKRVGTLTSSYVVARLSKDTSDLPCDTLVHGALIDSVLASSIGTSYGWHTFTFDAPQDIDSMSQYHLTLSATYACSTDNYVRVLVESVTSGGDIEINADSVWQDSAQYAIVGYSQVMNFSDISGTTFDNATHSAGVFDTKDINLRSCNKYIRMKLTSVGTDGSFVSSGLVTLGEARKRPVTD